MASRTRSGLAELVKTAFEGKSSNVYTSRMGICANCVGHLE
jgi:hypothetical protein